MSDKRDMRQRADWMVPADDRILEAVRDDGNQTPKSVSKEGLVPRVGVGRKWASERMRELADYGLLERIDEGLYGITEVGLAYLEEELDAGELESVADS